MRDIDKKVFGEFPEFCYKVYNNKEYAKQFINTGTFLMGCINSYRHIEDQSRRDPTEGNGLTKEPGIVTSYGFSQNPNEKTICVKEFGYNVHHTELLNPKFCFCTSLPEVDLIYMKKQFGRFIVKIKEPRQLAEDINDYLFSTGEKYRIEGWKIVYNKGQKSERELTANERIDLSYKQKPEEFIDDFEFRIVAIRYGPCKQECKFLNGLLEQIEPECKFIKVNLNKKLKYLQPIFD